MAIVFTGQFYVRQAEWTSGPQFSIHAYDDVDDNYNTILEVIGGSITPYLDPDAGFMVLDQEWLANYKGFEDGQTIFTVDIKATHSWYNWDTQSWVTTIGTQTYTVEVTDVAPNRPVVYTDYGRIAETAQTGDTITTASGYEWSFQKGSVGDGTGDPQVWMSDNAGGRFQLELIDDKYVVTVANAALIDYTGHQSSTYTVTIAVSDGTTTVYEDFNILIDNVAPSTPVDIAGGQGATINEHLATGSAIGVQMHAADPKGGAITYSFDPYENRWYAAAFDIDAATGAITVKDASLVNFESFEDGEVTLYVVASDDHGMTSTGTVVIQVNDLNDAPVIQGPLAFTVAENIMAVGTVTATDQDILPTPDTLTYSLTGTDAALFTIDADGIIAFKAAPNFEIPKDADKDNVYSFNVRVSDGTTTTTEAATVTVADVNEKPVVSGASVTTINVAEDTSTSTPIYRIVASDPEGQQLTFTPANVEAFFFFTVDSDGYVYFNDRPDFENPGDLNLDNLYEAVFVVSDGTFEVERTLKINVTDVNNAPVITNYAGATALRLVDENWNFAIDFFSASDADNDALTWSVSGTDASLFSIDSHGILRMKAPADFEHPLDANKDNIYQVTVKVSDGKLSDSVAMSVKIEDKVEARVTKIMTHGGGDSATVTLLENNKSLGSVSAVGERAISYSLVGGSDQGLFTINSTTGALSLRNAPDFEKPADANKDNIYSVIVRASDGLTTDQQTLNVKIANVNEAPAITSNGGGSKASISIKENTTAAVTTVIAADPEKAKLTYSLSGTDSGDFTISNTGVLTFRTAPDFERPADANLDNKYLVTVKVSDGTNATSQDLTVSVGNVAGKTIVGTGKTGATLTGTGEEDKITGTVVKDTIKAGAGPDVIEGGKGADQLYGGSKDLARDVFVFKVGDSTVPADGQDKIYEFEKGIDRIDLSKIDADTASGMQELRFVKDFSKAEGSAPDGQFKITTDGKHSFVHIDHNGDLKADMIFQVMSVTGLGQSDFLL